MLAPTATWNDKDKRVAAILNVLKQSEYSDKLLTPSIVTPLSTTLQTLLCLDDSSLPALKQTVLEFIGNALDEERLEQIAKKLVFGKRSLLCGVVVSDHNMRSGPVEVKCTGVRITNDKPPKVEIVVEIQSGPSSCAIEHITCSVNAFQHIANKVGAQGKQKVAIHPNQIVGFSFMITVRIDSSNRLSIDSYYATPEQRSKNGVIRRKRLEKSKQCNKLCHYCPKTTEACGYATHDKAWVARKCPNGHVAYFDNVGRCLHCLEKKLASAGNILYFGEDL